MNILSASQMADADRYTIETLGIPSMLLMENAGVATVNAIVNHLPCPKKIAILCGTGNNGGDGYVIARHLHLRGYQVEIFRLGLPKTPDSQTMAACTERLVIPCHDVAHFDPAAWDAVIDALFGTGFKGSLAGMAAEVITRAQKVPFRVAVDIPSGVCGTTGRIQGVAFCAHLTVTFEFPKQGHFLLPGASVCGALLVAPIGVSDTCLPAHLPVLLSLGDHPPVPKREAQGHKGSFGHLLCIGGSMGKAGAIAFSASAAFEAGAGLVTIAAPTEIIPILQTLVPQSMVMPLDSSHHQENLKLMTQSNANACVIGPGMGREPRSFNVVIDLLRNSQIPMVVDADALYCDETTRGDLLDALAASQIPTIITPHPGEFSRLTGIASAEIEANKFDLVASFATTHRCVLLLKGARTAIATPAGECWLLDTPNNALAKGGSGDVLSGIIGGFLAQGLPPVQAALGGALVHARAGQSMRQKTGSFAGTPQKLISEIGGVLKILDEQ